MNRTPHRASFTCNTHAVFLVCTWLKFWGPALDRIVGWWFLRACKVIPSPPCFTAPCLTHSCLRTSLHRFLHLHLVCLPLLRCYPSMCPLPLCMEGYALVDWLKNCLSQVMSPSLSSKSAANTLRLTYLRKRAFSTRTLTISRPLWMRLKSTTQTWDG